MPCTKYSVQSCTIPRDIEGRGLHSTAWYWHPASGPPMLKEDWSTPNEFGTFVRDDLCKYNR